MPENINEAGGADDGLAAKDPDLQLANPIPVPTGGVTRLELQRAGADNLADLPLWVAIDLHTEYVSFRRFQSFVQVVFCEDKDKHNGPTEEHPEDAVADLRGGARNPPLAAYELLMQTAEVFLLTRAGVWNFSDDPFPTIQVKGYGPGMNDRRGDEVPREALRLVDEKVTFQQLNDQLKTFLGNDANNYLGAVLEANYHDTKGAVSPFCPAYLGKTGPYLLELIWSYWMEEAMLAQAMAAIKLRFQNLRHPSIGSLPDLTLDPLRPLSHFLWTYIENESRHLSVRRRAHEYIHQYGFGLHGKAARGPGAADARLPFLSSFHNLLRQCAIFYRADADTTVIADAFPVLNSLKDLNLVLSQGADNQFRDLAWQARAEMLVQQWLLARPEMREFLHAKPMVAYPEGWMPPLEALRHRLGWGGASVTHFYDLARFGERILLSVRYGNWTGVSNQDVARTWARYWKPEIQGYIHAYRTVTDVDLSDEALPLETRNEMPSKLLLRKARQRRRVGAG
jgi:hypothetical protein